MEKVKLNTIYGSCIINLDKKYIDTAKVFPWILGLSLVSMTTSYMAWSGIGDVLGFMSLYYCVSFSLVTASLLCSAFFAYKSSVEKIMKTNIFNGPIINWRWVEFSFFIVLVIVYFFCKNYHS